VNLKRGVLSDYYSVKKNYYSFEKAREAEISFCSLFPALLVLCLLAFLMTYVSVGAWTKGVQSSALNLPTVPLAYESSQCLSYRTVLEVFKVTEVTNVYVKHIKIVKFLVYMEFDGVRVSLYRVVE
jgi:hypothetical protein